MKNYSIAHKFFIISGIILAISCMITSSFPCIEHSAIHAETIHSTKSIDSFDSTIFLIFGIVEILLLFTSNHSLRQFAVLISLTKIALPWLSIVAYNFTGDILSDTSWNYTIINNYPYITTLLAILLFIQHLLMYIFISPNHK